MSPARRRTGAVACVTVGTAACAAVCIGLVHLLSVGTCASGGAFEIERQCPAGTAACLAPLVLGLIVSVIAMLATTAFTEGGWRLVYSLLFLSAGTTMLVSALTGQGSPGAGLASSIIAATFLPMGLWPVVAWLSTWLGRSEQRALSRRGVVAEATVSAVETLVSYPTGERRIRVSYAVLALNAPSLELQRELNALPAQVPARGERVQVRYDTRHPERFVVQ